MAQPPELDARVVFKTFTDVLICGGKAGVTGRCVRAVTVTAVCSKWRRRRRRRRRGRGKAYRLCIEASFQY